jgi:hypothetical protein
LKENDEHVYDSSKEWFGKASMSETHLFVVHRDLSDSTLINGLVLGINDPKSALSLLQEMREYSKKHIPADCEPGYFLHITPFNSIQLLHLKLIKKYLIKTNFKY